MKILITTEMVLQPEKNGGGERAVSTLAEQFRKEGHEVLVAAPHFSDISLQRDDLKPYRVIRCKRLLVPGDQVSIPSPQIKDEICKFAPDAVLMNNVGGLSMYAVEYAQERGIPAIHTIHVYYQGDIPNSIPIFTPKRRFWIENVKKFFGEEMNMADRVVCVSEHQAKIYKEQFGVTSPMKVIRNGTIFPMPNDLDALKQVADKTFGLGEAETVFLHVGRLESGKRVDFSLRGLAEVKRALSVHGKRTDFQFVIVGTGAEKENLALQAAELGLQENTRFLGGLSDDELKSVYARSDLLLAPSLGETDSIAVAEAACHKVPSLVCKNTGAEGKIQDGVSGFHFENNINSHAGKILEIMHNKPLLE